MKFFKSTIFFIAVLGIVTNLYSEFIDITNVLQGYHDQKSISVMTINGGRGEKVVFILPQDQNELVRVLRIDAGNNSYDISPICGIDLGYLENVSCVKTGINKDSQFVLILYQNGEARLFLWDEDRFMDCSYGRGLDLTHIQDLRPEYIKTVTFNYDPNSKILAIINPQGCTSVPSNLMPEVEYIWDSQVSSIIRLFRFNEQDKTFIFVSNLERANHIYFNPCSINASMLILYDNIYDKKPAQLVYLDSNNKIVNVSDQYSGLENLDKASFVHVIRFDEGTYRIYTLVTHDILKMLCLDQEQQKVSDITNNCQLEGDIFGKSCSFIEFSGNSLTQLVCIKYFPEIFSSKNVITLFELSDRVFTQIIDAELDAFLKDSKSIEIIQDTCGTTVFLSGQNIKVLYFPEMIRKSFSSLGSKKAN